MSRDIVWTTQFKKDYKLALKRHLDVGLLDEIIRALSRGETLPEKILTSGGLNTYLAEIDKQAQERFERLIEDMKRVQDITEQLKAENALEWTGRLNNIRACVREIVERKIIYA